MTVDWFKAYRNGDIMRDVTVRHGEAYGFK
jgi:hypothetical protein